MSINFPAPEILEFCRRNRIRRLSAYGSVLRSDFRPDSDVDLLVEFEPGHKVGFLRLAQLELELGGMIGRRVDLRTPGELSPLFRGQVQAASSVLYAA